MIQTQNIIKNQDEIINCILTITKINKIYIFGSYARGEQTQESDIDFYIVLENNLNVDSHFIFSNNPRIKLSNKTNPFQNKISNFQIIFPIFAK